MAKNRNQSKDKSPEQLAREQYAEDAKQTLYDLTRQYQAGGYEYFLEFLTGDIDSENGKIKYTNRNLTKVQKLINWFSGWGNKFQRYILKPILKGAAEMLDLNDKYFASITQKSIPDKARYRALLLWGYDSDKKTIVPGSYLDSIFTGTKGIAQRVGGLLNQAIGAQMSLKDFRDQFRAIFVGKPGGGMLESQFKRATFDLFQTVDRAANYEYANSLGLNYAIYSGTVMDTTRDFCEERVNRVFSRKQIEGWSNLTWSGKTLIYNPYLHCGGYNCRHHLSFISDEMAEMLLKRQK